MNSQSRIKMVVPIGNKTTDKAKQALRNLTNVAAQRAFNTRI